MDYFVEGVNMTARATLKRRNTGTVQFVDCHWVETEEAFDPWAVATRQDDRWVPVAVDWILEYALEN